MIVNKTIAGWFETHAHRMHIARQEENEEYCQKEE